MGGAVTRMSIACVMATIGLAAQATGVLRVTVTLTDADGTTTPIPRVVLLVSDNPATGEPRRIRIRHPAAAKPKLVSTTSWAEACTRG